MIKSQQSRGIKWTHVLWWAGLYIFWVMVFQRRAFTLSRTATVELCYLLFIAGNYYFNVGYTIPRHLHRKKYVAFALLMAMGITVAALLRVPLATYLNSHFFLVGLPQPGFATLFTNSLLNISLWTVSLVSARLITDRFRFQQYVDNVIKEKEAAELAFLNAQFNPHFLFNSLNSIYGHIDKSNTIARSMLLTFSDMLRYQLYDCNNSTISIDKEMTYIRNYVALQAARKEDSLAVHLHIDDSVKGFNIAPLLFIAFIENSFKYASTADETENKVEIKFTAADNVLHFECYNTKDPDYRADMEHKGIGIANAKRRLSLLYPGRHLLETTNNELFYNVKLQLQL